MWIEEILRAQRADVMEWYRNKLEREAMDCTNSNENWWNFNCSGLDDNEWTEVTKPACNDQSNRPSFDIMSQITKDMLRDDGIDQLTLNFGGLPYSFNSTPNPAPAPTAAIQTFDELHTEHQKAVEELLSSLPLVRQLMLYQYLNAKGFRISTITHEINREISKELHEQRKNA